MMSRLDHFVCMAAVRKFSRGVFPVSYLRCALRVESVCILFELNFLYIREYLRSWLVHIGLGRNKWSGRCLELKEKVKVTREIVRIL